MASGFDIAFITLGCAKNEVDSNKMKAKLLASGYEIIDDPAEADLTVINTCSFLTSAVEEGLDIIFDAIGDHAEGLDPNRVLVTGCMPSRYGDDLAEELPEAAGFLPADQEDLIVQKVDKILGNATGCHATFSRVVEGPSAYVKISDGCDRFCSYCMIPYIRGRYHSYPYAQIRDEVSELVEAGTKEIVLIGQDTGIWGKDLSEPSTTLDLLKGLSSEFPETWFRIMYIQPEGIYDELVTFMDQTPNVCSYIDIPLQHVNGNILKDMNRTGSNVELAQLIDTIRRIAPNMMIRTTLMTGFPGESDENFQELIDFVEQHPFDYAGVFAYSQEEGSKACDMPNQVPESIRLQRAQELLDLCDACGFARTKDHIGQEVMAMVVGYEDTEVGTEALARWQGQAPDVDGLIHIPMTNDSWLEIGDMVDVRLTDSFCYELEGVLIG